jgi:hypothetical protein
MTEKSTGNCYLCGANLGKNAMKTHLFKLHGDDEGGQECSLLKIEGVYDKDYWLYADIPMDKTLKALDSFLRKIWLECCGHMSAFSFSGHVEAGMSRKLGNFAIGAKLFHEYDFGTTTETVITIMGITKRKPQKETVRLLARNVPPVFQCADCGKTAEYISREYTDSNEPLFYCEECRDKNEDGEYMLPVTNSPRMGECGYEGEYDKFTFDPASFTQK